MLCIKGLYIHLGIWSHIFRKCLHSPYPLLVFASAMKNSFINFFTRLIFFFQIHNKFEQEVQDIFPIYSLPPTRFTFSIINVPHQCSMFVSIMSIITIQGPQFTLELLLGVVLSVDFDKYIMTSIHHYRISQNNLTALKILCILPSHSYLPTHL